MTIHRDTFDIYKTGDIDYSLTGGSGEGISWRNVFGQMITAVVANTDNIPAAGIYEVTIDEDSWDAFVAYAVAHGDNYGTANNVSPLKVNVTSCDDHNKLSFSADTSVVISVFSSTGQTGIIPGFTLTFSQWPNIHLYDKFQLIVGGRWLASEDRYIKDMIFGELSSSGPVTSGVAFTVENIGDTTLTKVEAKVVNKISILQDDNMLKSDVSTQIWAQVSDYYGDHNDGYIVHPYDITVAMTAIDTPVPIKSFQTGQGNGIWRLFERTTNLPNPGYPSNPYSQTPIWVGEYSAVSPNFAAGSVAAYRRCLNEVNAIRYDFGKGNFKLINGLTLWDKYWLVSFFLYGSRDDVDIPQNWDFLLDSTDLGGGHIARLFYTDHYVWYWYFNTVKEYRHFKLVPNEIEFVSNTIPENSIMLPSINRIEFLSIPIPTTYKPYTYKPFSFIARNNGGNPIVANYNEQPVQVTFRNVANDIADILVDKKSYDVYEVVSGIRIAEGKGLLCDGTTEYVFADSSPYAGLAFKLSAALETESIAQIYTTHGSEVFEVCSDDNIWMTKGEKVSVADTLAPDETFELSVRANPVPGSTNPVDYPVEGLVEITGYSETTASLFTGSMVFDSSPSAGYSSVRNVIGPFNFTGTQIRFKFKDTSTPIYGVYFGPQLLNCKFGTGKINLTFDEGAWTSSAMTEIWTDWMPFDFMPGVTYLLSFEGGDGTYRNDTYICVSYRCKNNTSQIDDVEYSTTQATSCLGIVAMELVILEPHIAVVPFAAVVRDAIPSFAIDVNIVDEATAAALAEYGIVGVQVS